MTEQEKTYLIDLQRLDRNNQFIKNKLANISLEVYNAVKTAYESGEFKGEKGDKPIKGIDYFTEEDIKGLPYATLSDIEKQKIDYLATLTKTGGAVYNKDTGYFELNGINNLTYDEMLTIWGCQTQGITNHGYLSVGRTTLRNGSLINYSEAFGKLNVGQFVRNNASIEVIQLFGGGLNGNVSNAHLKLTISTNSAQGAKKVKHWYDWIDCSTTYYSSNLCGSQSYSFVGGAINLETICIWKLEKDAYFNKNKNLNYFSIKFMIAKSHATTPINVTLNSVALANARASYLTDTNKASDIPENKTWSGTGTLIDFSLYPTLDDFASAMNITLIEKDTY